MGGGKHFLLPRGLSTRLVVYVLVVVQECVFMHVSHYNLGVGLYGGHGSVTVLSTYELQGFCYAVKPWKHHLR